MNAGTKMVALQVLNLLCWAMEFATPSIDNSCLHAVQAACWTEDDERIVTAFETLVRRGEVGATTFKLSQRCEVEYYLTDSGRKAMTVTKNETPRGDFDWCYDISVIDGELCIV